MKSLEKNTIFSFKCYYDLLSSSCETLGKVLGTHLSQPFPAPEVRGFEVFCIFFSGFLLKWDYWDHGKLVPRNAPLPAIPSSRSQRFPGILDFFSVISCRNRIIETMVGWFPGTHLSLQFLTLEVRGSEVIWISFQLLHVQTILLRPWKFDS